MGRPSIEKKRAKRKRQKMKRFAASSSLNNVPADVTSHPQDEGDSCPIDVPMCTSPLLFSDSLSATHLFQILTLLLKHMLLTHRLINHTMMLVLVMMTLI